MHSMHQRCGELTLAIFLQNMELIDVANTGIFCHQLNPACSLPIFLDKKIMDMLITQSFHMDALSLSGETVISCFGMLKRFCLVNVERNSADVQWKIVPYDRPGSDEFHSKL